MDLERRQEVMQEAPLHFGWDRYVRALQSAGLVSELSIGSLPDRLGSIASRVPDAASKAAFLEAYFRGDGDVDAALRRTSFDRYVAHHESAPALAHTFVARLRLAARELGTLALVQDEHRRGLLLRTAHATARVAQLNVVRRGMSLVDSLHGGQIVDVRALVAAANELLEKRAFAFRFLPLDAAMGVEAFLAVDPTDALLLEYGNVLERSLDQLRGFARWDPRGPLIAIGAAG